MRKNSKGWKSMRFYLFIIFFFLKTVDFSYTAVLKFVIKNKINMEMFQWIGQMAECVEYSCIKLLTFDAYIQILEQTNVIFVWSIVGFDR